MILALVLAGAAAAGLANPALSPALQSAITDGVKACIGSTVDPEGQAGRVRGWTPATPEQRPSTNAKGEVLTHDNVMLIYKAGFDGGCVVLAQGDTGFDRARFFADVSKIAGIQVRGKRRKLVLPNGELMAIEVSGSAAQGKATFPPNPSANYVVVAVANRASELAKHSKGTDG